MDIKNLTAEERAQLRAQFEAEEQADVARIRKEREDYKNMVDVFVASNIKKLQSASAMLLKVKEEVFSEAATLIDMKNELFKVKSDRRSDTFTTQDGTMSIMLGNRVNEGWDDTANAGISKVKDYLSSLARDEETGDLVDMVMSLMAKDHKGNLKASKVLELEKIAAKRGNKTFLEGVEIIKQAYRPVPSCEFIEARVKDEKGNEVKLPLSLGALK